ncbi:MAG: hypothetical protein KGN36_05990, partial [Acidobacteriota bacterium]|nr:hypothetical protein [Acidobacteriota bacterium]
MALLVLWSAGRLFGLDPGLRVSQYHKQYWEVEQGLPHSYVTAIAQDAEGYLLAGTDEGLARFDGLTFQPLPSDPSLGLARSWISAILRTADSRLWLGTFDGRLIELRKGETLATYRTDGSVFDLVEDAGHTLLISTRGGVLRLDAHGLQRVEGLGPPLDTSWNVFSRDARGRVWIVTASGLYCEEGGVISKRLSRAPGGEILTVLARRSGTILVGATNGLFELAQGGAAGPRIASVPGPVVSLLEDRDGIVWAGTWGQGLYRITDGGTQGWTARDGLPEDFIRTLQEDSEGDLWIGMRGSGLGRWKDSRLVPLGPPEGLAGSFAATVAADPAGNLWLGTWRGGLYQLNGGKLVSKPTPLPTLYFTVRALAFDAAGYPWVGNWEGLFQYDGKQYHHFAAEPDAPYRRVSALLFDHAGGLWVGTADHGVFHFPGGRPGGNIPPPLQPDSEITALLEDSARNIWVGTSKGLGRFAGRRPSSFSMVRELPPGEVKSIFEDSRHRVWTSTSAGTLAVIHPAGTLVLGRKQGLPGQPLYRILEATDGSFWVSSSKGVLELTAESVEQVLSGKRNLLDIVVHDQSDGMRTIECHGLSQPSGWRARDGSLFFPTANGFVQVRPAANRRQPPPKPVILEIRGESGPLPFAPEVSLRAGARNLEIAFSALRLSNPRGVTFRYRITDFDPDWVDAGTQRSARYNRLPPGAHIFELEARDPLGPWSGKVSLRLRQMPLFYQTWWFLFSLGLAGVSAVIGIYRWHLHAVHARYGLVLEERNRIGREWHDTLVAGFSAISLQLEAAMSRLRDQPDRAAELLDVARRMVHHYRAEARRVIWDLRDSRPEGETLGAAVEGALARLRETRGVGGSVRITGQPVALAAETQHNLLRICQEAMSNAVRHGCPENVEVELAFAADRVKAAVRDDGCGFPVDTASAESAGHFGL